MSIDGSLPGRDQLIADIAATGAIVRGHFQLSSGGLHSLHFFRFRRLAASKEALSHAAEELLRASGLDRSSPCVVLAPESAGALLADELATTLDAPLALARLDDHPRPTTSLLGDAPLSGARVLVVNDVTTSQSGLETLTGAVREQQGEVGAVLVYGALKRDAFDGSGCHPDHRPTSVRSPRA